MAVRKPIQLSEETHQWLCKERDRLLEDADRCGGYRHAAIQDEPKGGKPALSLEAVIVTLLDARQRHRERRRLAKLNARAKRPKKRPRKAPLPD